jgi:hypothetical protein
MASRDPRLKRLRSRAEDQTIAGQRVGRTPEPAGMSALLAQPEMATRRLDWEAGHIGFEPPHGGIKIRSLSLDIRHLRLSKMENCSGITRPVKGLPRIWKNQANRPGAWLRLLAIGRRADTNPYRARFVDRWNFECNNIAPDKG